MLKETKRSDEIKHYLYALRWARESEGGRRRGREEGRDEGGRETERGEWEGWRVRERESSLRSLAGAGHCSVSGFSEVPGSIPNTGFPL